MSEQATPTEALRDARALARFAVVGDSESITLLLGMYDGEGKDAERTHLVGALISLALALSVMLGNATGLAPAEVLNHIVVREDV
jgi:hypothetical protein